RTCTAADWPAYTVALEAAFGNALSDEASASWAAMLDPRKLLAATDCQDGREQIVGTAGWLPFDMTVPGGELPTAAVTMVTVPPPHRRRGGVWPLTRPPQT